MGKINVLDSKIANMIAAGEVVERPASVVKELVENSIDAGAKNIVIEIKNGGMSFIRVTDDGSGIAPDDLKTAFLPHATSKIKTEADLDKIYTLGFRGEALASIAAVSKLSIFTKTKENPLGKLLSLEGGNVVEESDTGCADGTTVVVRNLFFNTPARMKFLKKDSTETSYITDLVNKLILGNPNVSIKYISTGKQTLSSGNGKLIDSIYAVYGKDYINHLIEVDYQDENINVTGFVGNNSISKSTRSFQTFYINGRNIISKTISAAVLEAYKNAIMVGKFPFAVLNISISPSFVDVNVHPTKLEVRFSDDKKMFTAVYWAVKNALIKNKHIPQIEFKKPVFENAPNAEKSEQSQINFLKDSFIKERTYYIKEDNYKMSSDSKDLNNNTNKNSFSNMLQDDVENAALNYNKEQKHDELKDSTKTAFKESLSKENQDSFEKNNEISTLSPGIDFKIVGQVFDTYIIIQKGDEMHFIDQHAAHERLYFEQLLKSFESKDFVSQILFMPETIDLSPIEFDFARNNINFFTDLGFELEVFGNNVIIVRSVPAMFVDSNLKDVISDILKVISKGITNITDAQIEALHTLACRRALKGNRHLSTQEMEKLVSDVFTLENINTCPHGRPIELKTSKKELEKQFKRIVN